MGETYRTYPKRWFVLKGLVFLSLGCYMMNVSFASVATLAAQYYGVSGDQIDIISLSQNLVTIPGIWIAIFVIEKLELLYSLRLASGISLLGCIIRGASTFPLLENSLSPQTRFWITFMGQIVISMGYPICTIMVTKVSQVWFSERERPLSTALLAMSQMVGALIGQGLTPLIMQGDPNNIPKLNLMLPTPILVSFLLWYGFIRQNAPKTPPSRSAEYLLKNKEIKTLGGVMRDVKVVLRNKTACMLALCQGSTIGCTLLILTQLNQYMCARNYSTSESSITVVVSILSGLVGSFVIGYTVKRLNIQTIAFKVSYVLLSLIFGLFLHVVTLRDSFPWIVLLGCLNFIIGCGCFGVALELAVEETFPIDPIIGESCIHMMGQILGILYVMVGNLIYWDLPEDAPQSCTTNELGVIARDYSPFFYSLDGLNALLTVGVILFVNPKMRRQDADRTD